MKIVYLASPYSHVDNRVRNARYVEACRKAAEMVRDGVYVFSPIVHSHPIAQLGTPITWKFWADFDRKMLGICSEMRVLRLTGWTESEGVKEEIRIASEMGMPVTYTDPE